MRGVAILVDGDFFLRLFIKKFDTNKSKSTIELAKMMWRYWVRHVDRKHEQLHRIYFYDCPPLTSIQYHPITKRNIDFSRTAQGLFRQKLHEHLVKQPNVALRKGFLDENNARWVVKDAKKHKQLLSGQIAMSDLQDW